MQQIVFLTKEDIKTAVLEALSEHQTQTPPTAPEPEQRIYGLKNLADFLGVGITTCWKLKKSGKLPFYQAGKKLYFKKSEIEAVLSNRIW